MERNGEGVSCVVLKYIYWISKYSSDKIVLEEILVRPKVL